MKVAETLSAHDRIAEGFRTMWTVRGFLLLQITIFLALVSIHFGLQAISRSQGDQTCGLRGGEW
jgi:hypothetical protein